MTSVDIGAAVIIRSFEDRLDKMSDELKESRTETQILRFEIEQLGRQLKLRKAERDFAEKQLDRIRRTLG